MEKDSNIRPTAWKLSALTTKVPINIGAVRLINKCVNITQVENNA